jgi:hypothetical protein
MTGPEGQLVKRLYARILSNLLGTAKAIFEDNAFRLGAVDGWQQHPVGARVITTAWHLFGGIVEQERNKHSLWRVPLLRPAYHGTAARLGSAVTPVFS